MFANVGVSKARSCLVRSAYVVGPIADPVVVIGLTRLGPSRCSRCAIRIGIVKQTGNMHRGDGPRWFAEVLDVR